MVRLLGGGGELFSDEEGRLLLTRGAMAGTLRAMDKRTKVDLPPALKKRAEKAAAESRRSLSAWIVVAVEAMLDTAKGAK